LNYVKGQFASSVDTIGEARNNRRRTILLATSPGSRKRDVPLYISMEEVTLQPDPAMYNAGPLPVAILTEGVFSSFFTNYPVPEGVSMGTEEVLSESAPTSVLVVSDGDIPANDVRFDQGVFRAQPLGYDRYTRQTFGNLEFIMNVVNLMTDDTGIMELRSREFKLRLLNREITGQFEEVWKWKLINGTVPVALVALCGLIVFLVRIKRYSR
jgi:ABC-2 type transport system permease protein